MFFITDCRAHTVRPSHTLVPRDGWTERLKKEKKFLTSWKHSTYRPLFWSTKRHHITNNTFNSLPSVRFLIRSHVVQRFAIEQPPVTVLSPEYTKIFPLDYFEIDRLIEDLPKLYSCSCATSWFKVEGRWNPTRDEFRDKVVEFMNHFEYTLSAFPDNPESEKFKSHTRELLHKELKMVLKGDNKEVEKRYTYFVNST